jgi:hypothetical protein
MGEYSTRTRERYPTSDEDKLELSVGLSIPSVR